MSIVIAVLTFTQPNDETLYILRSILVIAMVFIPILLIFGIRVIRHAISCGTASERLLDNMVSRSITGSVGSTTASTKSIKEDSPHTKTRSLELRYTMKKSSMEAPKAALKKQGQEPFRISSFTRAEA